MKYRLTFFFFIFCLANLQSQTRGSLFVLVTEIDGSTPIENATVRIDEAGFASKTTGRDGKIFYGKNMPITKIHYTVSKEGYQNKGGTFNITTDEKSNTLSVKLKRDEKLLIYGEVTDKNDNELFEASVEVKIADIVKTTTTDESGNYSIILDRPKFEVASIIIEVKCFNGNGKKGEVIDFPKKNNIIKNFKLDCNSAITSEIISDPHIESINRWFGFGLLAEVGCGTIGYTDNACDFLAVPYGAFLRAYMTERLAFELQYHRSVLSINDDLAYTWEGEKSGEIWASFAYQDVTALLNLMSIRSQKNRLRLYGGTKVSFRRSAEFEVTRTQSNFVGSGELPTLPQYTSVVIGYGVEFGGFGHKLPLIIVDLRSDFGTKILMREFIIPETNTRLEFGHVWSFGLQVGIGF